MSIEIKKEQLTYIKTTEDLENLLGQKITVVDEFELWGETVLLSNFTGYVVTGIVRNPTKCRCTSYEVVAGFGTAKIRVGTGYFEGEIP